MATHSSILAWRRRKSSSLTEEPGGLQFMESWRVRHDWVTNTHTHTHLSSTSFGNRPCLLVTWDTWPRRANPIPHLLSHCGCGSICIISWGLCSNLWGEGEEVTVGSDPGLMSRWALPIATFPPHGEAGLGKWHQAGVKRRKSEYTEGIFEPLNPTTFLYGLVIWTNKFLL